MASALQGLLAFNWNICNTKGAIESVCINGVSIYEWVECRHNVRAFFLQGQSKLFVTRAGYKESPFYSFPFGQAEANIY